MCTDFLNTGCCQVRVSVRLHFQQRDGKAAATNERVAQNDISSVILPSRLFIDIAKI